MHSGYPFFLPQPQTQPLGGTLRRRAPTRRRRGALREAWRPCMFRPVAAGLVLLAQMCLLRAASVRAPSAGAPPGRVAVVGGGMAGLSVAYHLAQGGAKSIAVFDPDEVGTGGASAAASGILHPLSPKGKIMWQGEEGLRTARAMIEEAARFASPGESIVVSDTVIRPLMSEENAAVFAKAIALDGSALEFLPAEKLQAAAGGLSVAPRATDAAAGLGGYRIQGGIIIDVPLYLRCLWRAVADAVGDGAEWHRRSVDIGGGGTAGALPLAGLATDYDAVVVAAGRSLASAADLGLQSVRGQNVMLGLRRGAAASAPAAEPLAAGLLAGEYLLPTGRAAAGFDQVLCAGATKEFLDGAPPGGGGGGEEEAAADLRAAVARLGAKMEPFRPGILGGSGAGGDGNGGGASDGYELTPLYAKSGTRVHARRTNLGRIPIAGRFPAGEDAPGEGNTWCLGALGARGLIHHALLGHSVAGAVLSGDETRIPAECRAPLEGKR